MYETEMYELDKLSHGDSQKEWHKCAFEIKLENIYVMKSWNDMNRINDNKVNNMVEFNLLHDILNPSKHTKI